MTCSLAVKIQPRITNDAATEAMRVSTDKGLAGPEEWISHPLLQSREMQDYIAEPSLI